MLIKPSDNQETSDIFKLPENYQTNIELFREIAEHRSLFTEEMALKIKESEYIKDFDEAIKKWLATILDIISNIQEQGFSYKNADPWHWVWHLLRDTLHSSVIVGNTDEETSKNSPSEVYVWFVCSALHDIGCVVIDRYQDVNSINKHAEIWWLIVGRFLKEATDIPEEIINAIVWWIMAHTNIKKDFKMSVDWEEYIIPPYKDTHDSWEPIYFVDVVKQTDRLDVNWLIFICRHFLTRYRTIADFSWWDYRMQSFNQHMQFNGEVGTMLEHLKMYLRSQEEDNGIHNKNDLPSMIKQRKKYSKELGNFIKDIETTEEEDLINPEDIHNTLKEFLDFLDIYIEPRLDSENIGSEPNPKKPIYIDMLEKEFLNLDILIQRRWLTQLIKIKDHYPVFIDRLIGENDTTKYVSKVMFPKTTKTIWEILWYNINKKISDKVNKILW